MPIPISRKLLSKQLLCIAEGTKCVCTSNDELIIEKSTVEAVEILCARHPSAPLFRTFKFDTIDAWRQLYGRMGGFPKRKQRRAGTRLISKYRRSSNAIRSLAGIQCNTTRYIFTKINVKYDTTEAPWAPNLYIIVYCKDVGSW